MRRIPFSRKPASLAVIILTCFAVTHAIANDESLDTDGIQSAMSANRSMITRFKSEHDDLVKRSDAKASEETQKRIRSLKNKMAVLKNDNERLTWMLKNPPAQKIKPAKALSDLKGRDWLQMDRADKELFMFSAMGALIKRDVLVMEPSYFYIDLLDELSAAGRNFEDENLDNLVILSIYKFEPDTRESIESFRKVKADELKAVNPR